MRTKRNSRSGFTLVELMIVVAIVGILAAIAISAYGSYITSARVSEALSFMQDIRTKQEAYYSERSQYLGCNYNPSSTPKAKVSWATGDSCWENLGVQPSGSVRFQFATGSNASDPAGEATDLAGFTADDEGDWFYVVGRADLDEDPSTDPTTLVTNNLSNNPVILDEGQ